MSAADRLPPVNKGDCRVTVAVPRASQMAKATLRDLPGGEWLIKCADRALERTMAHKEAAIVMGVDRAQLTRELEGTGHLSMKRLGLLGRDFFEALIDEIREHFQLADDEERLQRALAMRAKADEEIERIARKALR